MNKLLNDRSETEKLEMQAREFNGKNWPFHVLMNDFMRGFWSGIKKYPNLREINSEEFAANNCISGSYGCKLLGTASTLYMPGIPYTLYAKVMFQTVQGDAGRGVAFVAVPVDEKHYDKSRHKKVPLKLRHWEFCLCDHKFKQSAYRNCNTTYVCSECNWHYDVDSSG